MSRGNPNNLRTGDIVRPIKGRKRSRDCILSKDLKVRLTFVGEDTDYNGYTHITGIILQGNTRSFGTWGQSRHKNQKIDLYADAFEKDPNGESIEEYDIY